MPAPCAPRSHRRPALPAALLLFLLLLPGSLQFFGGSRSASRQGGGADPEASVAQGRLRGRTLRSSRGTAYAAFSGIPYATPPVGDLRFKAPRPPDAWPGVRDARAEGRICTQPLLNLTKVLVTRIPKSMEPFRPSEIPGLIRAQPWLLRTLGNILNSGEDCLYLNVYTPTVAANASRAAGEGGLPVLFWIHGGAFTWGDGGMAMYDPDALMDHGVVVVTFNYRLGAFGFLSLGNGSGVPGNAGVKDMAAALRWVKDNIAAFGGDPDRITVWGESAGAVGTHLLLLSPSASSMIRGAILGSGSAAHFWSTVPAAHALERARSFAAAVRCGADVDTRLLAECLRRVPARRLAAAHERTLLPQDFRYITGSVGFVPVVEEADDALDPLDGPILSEEPRALVAAGRYAKVPMVVGFNSGEALILFSGLTRDPSLASLRVMDDNVTSLLRDDLFQRLTLSQAEDIAHRVRRFYFGHENPIQPYGPELDKFFEMATGQFIYLDTLMLTRLVAAQPDAAPLYLYNFKFVGALNVFRNILRIQQKETCHGDELAYVWRMHINIESHPVGPASPEMRMRDRFSTLVANFIRTGAPTPPATQPNVTWPPFSAQDQAYLEMGTELVVKKDYRRSTIAMWDDIYAKHVGGPIWTAIADLESRRWSAGVDPGCNLV